MPLPSRQTERFLRLLVPSSTCNLKASFPPSLMPLRCREPRTALFSKSPNTWVATTSAPSLLTQLKVSFVDKLSWTLVAPSWCPWVPRLLAESLMLLVSPSTKEAPLTPPSTAPSTEMPLHSSSKVLALRCSLLVSNNPFSTQQRQFTRENMLKQPATKLLGAERASRARRFGSLIFNNLFNNIII